jgi:hypothetical protein
LFTLTRVTHLGRNNLRSPVAWLIMSTRKLIFFSLLCGLAILVAGSLQLFLMSR